MALALLHGFAGQPRMWSDVLAALGEQRAVCPLLPGHGRSPSLGDGGFHDVVDRFAREELPSPAGLVGYSLGARLALAIALRHPRRLRWALLVGVHPGLTDEAERRDRIRWDDEQARFVEQHGVGAFIDRWEKLPLFASQQALDPSRLARQRADRLDHTPAGLAWAMRTLGLGRMPSLWPELERASVPLVLLTGALDPKFGRLAEQVVAVAGSARHHVIGGAGHNLPLEAPAEVAAAIAALSR